MELGCIRGAITAEQNTKEEILKATRELLLEVFQKNNISPEHILSILFTATKDLDAVYPAVAARDLGVTQGALMCMQEMDVVGSLKSCIRIMVTASLPGGQQAAKHVFLKGAKKLRPDISE